MTYVISDIHGDYEKFKKLLSEISFKESDVMYVLGDIIDFGDAPIELLCDLSMRYNVLPVLGECEYHALKLLGEIDRMLAGETPDPELLSEMAEWMQNGGKPTIEGFKALDADMREGVLDYLTDMAIFEDVKVNGKTYLLIHAGIADFDPEISPDEYMPEDFISTPLDPTKSYYEDITIIVGHNPTESGKIVYGETSIHLDCGVANGGPLGCLRLEDGKEFYIA